MTLDFLPEARAEFREAVRYYESTHPGLGQRFRSEIRDVCRLITRHPLMWRERSGGYRRVNCPVFPYYIAYFIRGDRILVAAVAHGHRLPDYWKRRTD